AWLALACTAAVLVFGWLVAGERRKAVLLIGLILLSVLVPAIAHVLFRGQEQLLGKVVERARQLFDDSNRWLLWNAGIRILEAHPVCGCGLDTFQLGFQHERPVEYWSDPRGEYWSDHW